MLGQTSKAQIIVARAKGWDPTVIPGEPVGGESAVNPDKAPNPIEMGANALGSLENIPGHQNDFGVATEDSLDSRVAWNAPDTKKEQPHNTNGASPWMGGRFGG